MTDDQDKAPQDTDEKAGKGPAMQSTHRVPTRPSKYDSLTGSGAPAPLGRHDTEKGQDR